MYTIGHSTQSTHSIDEFVGMLKANGIERLIDVRTVPGSRHNAQFGERELVKSMPEAGIDYQRLKELGGLRHTPAAEVTINGAWRNRSFRNYADYMQTPRARCQRRRVDCVGERGRRWRACVPRPCHGVVTDR